jgi:mannitol-1-phosphate 5-dehydrogenase
VDIDAQVGFVETSIGKMVPIMSERERKRDPLLVYAEAYTTLIVDRRGFRGPIPGIPQLDPKKNMKAYVDRKLYIHNLGHAVLGYVAHVFRPDYRFVWEAAFDEGIAGVSRGAMWESGRALIEEYPGELDEKNIGEHIDDLLRRFGNRALSDTIFRVGRDLYRKLGPEDRLIGAVNLCGKHGVVPERICLGVASAFFFRALDEQGHMFRKDREFHEKDMNRGVSHVLKNVCKLSDGKVISLIKRYYHMIEGGNKNLDSYSRV